MEKHVKVYLNWKSRLKNEMQIHEKFSSTLDPILSFFVKSQN